MKLTEWHDKGVKPVHVGVYEVRDAANSDYTAYAYWDGKKFCFRTFAAIRKDAQSCIDEAYKKRNDFTCLPKLTKWRGLFHKPRSMK